MNKYIVSRIEDSPLAHSRKAHLVSTLLADTRIFYIEDDRANRTIAQTIFEAHGAQMEFDAWGFAELSSPKLIRFRPNLILLDLMFPNQISGYDVFTSIRSRSQLKHIPIVAVSAADASIEIPKTQAHGFQGFISKPLDLRLFPVQIATILKGEAIWASY